MATYETLAKQVVRAINADSTNSFSAQSDHAAYPNQAIWEAILNGEAEVVHAILESPVHSRRAGNLTTSASVANGAQIPSHPGRLLGVVIGDVWAEHTLPVEEISRLNHADQQTFNPLKLTLIDYQFGVSGDNRLLFTGPSPATVYFGQYARPEFADYDAFLAGESLAPDEYMPAVFFCAMQVIGHEGTELGAMANYYNAGKAQINQIRGASQPTLKAMQGAAGE